MTTRWLALLLVVAACHSSGPPKSTLDPYAGHEIEVQVLLDERSARAARMDPLLDQVTITPRHLAVVSDRENLYLVGWGGTTPIEGLAKGLVAFDYTQDGLLLAVSDSALLYLDAAGALQPMFDLPSKGMGIARGGATMLLFDRTRSDGHAAIYELESGRHARKLLESPRPIDAVAKAGTRLYFATGGVAFEAVPGEKMRAVASLPGNVKILALAANTDGSRLYVSDGDAIYVVQGTQAALVTNALGGALRFDGNGLIVLDNKRRTLARIANLP